MLTEFILIIALKHRADKLTKRKNKQHLVIRRNNKLRIITSIMLKSTDELLFTSFKHT